MLFGALTAWAVLINGYHLGSDDGALYVPAIKKAADPALYPRFTDFFLSPARISIFPELVGWTSRFTGLPVDWAIFLWHFGCLFLLFQSAHQLLLLCFASRRARLGGLMLLAVTLAVPIAGTALILDDPYITARSLVLPLSLFAISAFLAKRPLIGFCWVAAAALIHPEAIYAGAFCLTFFLLQRFSLMRAARLAKPMLAASILLPLWRPFHPAVGPYRDVLASRPYLNILHWEWFEWMGAIAPLALFWRLSKVRSCKVRPPFQVVCRAALPFGICFTSAAVLLGLSSNFDYFIRYQPMRCFHLLYILLFLFLGALAGEFLLRHQVWRWFTVFLPLSGAMYFLSAAEYPSSPHIESPGTPYNSGYLQAFLWIRTHTPKSAVIGLDPDYTALPGVEMHGFQALAERSALANYRKDSGTVSLFPEFAEEWSQQVTAGTGWSSFRQQQIETFTRTYGIQWIVVGLSRSVFGWSCPYRNREVKVCFKQR